MKHDMSGEKPPIKRRLLPEGWRQFTIVNCEPSKSKSGNEMFIFDFEDEETKYIDKIYAISTQGKRWFLKSILMACGIEAGKDGIYDWEIRNVVGKQIMGLVEHEENEWIDRNGDPVKSTQHRIVEVKDLVAWDSDK